MEPEVLSLGGDGHGLEIVPGGHGVLSSTCPCGAPSAPDISGTGRARPLGVISSALMMLESRFGRADVARRIVRATETVHPGGVRTPDIGGESSTRSVAVAIVHELIASDAKESTA